MPKWLRTLALPAVAFALVASACSDNDADSGSGATGATGTTGSAEE